MASTSEPRATVGRVAALWRYPVKSMAAEAVEETQVSWHGLAGDRRWGFIRDGKVGSGFPWLTIREQPGMGQYRPSFVQPDRPDASRTVVRTPTGETLDVTDPVLAAELGHGARVIKQNRGVFDAMPLSLVTTASVATIGAMLGGELDPRRFRANLLIETTVEEPFPEDALIGRVLRIGELRMRVDRPDTRCVAVNIDPVTSQRDPAVLRAIAQAHDVRLGAYGSTVRPGRVVLGAPVVVEG